MSDKKNETDKSELDELSLDLEILDNIDMLSIIGGKTQAINWDTGLPGTVPQ